MKPRTRKRVYLLLIVFGFMGMFFNFFYGNPLSKTISKMHIQKFIKENSMGKQLNIVSIGHNIENSCYDATIIENETEIRYMVEANELGVHYQNINYSYDYKKRVVNYPSFAFFFSIGIIGIVLYIGHYIRMNIKQ